MTKLGKSGLNLAKIDKTWLNLAKCDMFLESPLAAQTGNVREVENLGKVGKVTLIEC